MFNIFTLVFFAVALGMLLAVIATRQKVPNMPSLVPPEEDADRDPKDVRELTLEDLFKVGEKLMTENELTLKDKIQISRMRYTGLRRARTSSSLETTS